MTVNEEAEEYYLDHQIKSTAYDNDDNDAQKNNCLEVVSRKRVDSSSGAASRTQVDLSGLKNYEQL